MLTTQEINCLGQCLNSTWGESTLGEFRTPTLSINTSFQGDILTCKYTTVVHLVSERNLKDQVRVHEDESLKLLKKYIAELKKKFKKSAGRALKIKEISTNESVELLTTSPYTPRKTAYYKRFSSYKVE